LYHPLTKLPIKEYKEPSRTPSQGVGCVPRTILKFRNGAWDAPYQIKTIAKSSS